MLRRKTNYLKSFRENSGKLPCKYAISIFWIFCPKKWVLKKSCFQVDGWEHSLKLSAATVLGMKERKSVVKYVYHSILHFNWCYWPVPFLREKGGWVNRCFRVKNDGFNFLLTPCPFLRCKYCSYSRSFYISVILKPISSLYYITRLTFEKDQIYSLSSSSSV